MTREGAKTPGAPPDLPGLFEEEAFGNDETRVTLGGAERALAPEAKRDRATLIVLTGGVVGAVYALDAEATILGRGQDTDFRIDDSGISRRHARITRDADGGFYLEDLRSTNGTTVAEAPVTEPHRLVDGDRIGLGKTVVLKFTLHDEFERTFHKQMYESAVRDPLTGAFNRKHLLDRLRTELSYAKRHGKSLAVLMLDIDHFKKVNDTLGHLAGDAALRALSELLMQQLRAEDVVARYGGEEFVLVAREIVAAAAVALAERVRRKTEELVVSWKPQGFGFTISVGIAFSPDGTGFDTPDQMLARADENMYAAKKGGRNRVVF